MQRITNKIFDHVLSPHVQHFLSFRFKYKYIQILKTTFVDIVRNYDNLSFLFYKRKSRNLSYL